MSLQTLEEEKDKLLLSDYHPRWYQKQFEEAMFGGYRRAYLLYHRRAGKDFSCWMFMIYCAAVCTPGVYYYILPTYTQGKKVIWDGMDESGKRLLEYIYPEMIEGKPNQTEMKIRLKNGSLIQVIGSDNPDAIRGTNPKGVVFSEYALQDPRIWSEIISPILVKNNGWAVFNTTPQGRNHAYDLWEGIQESPYWYKQKLTIEDTNLISKEQIERELAEGKSEEIVQQEYYVSWARGVDGTYYGRLIEKARQESRIGNVPYEPRSVVNTAWDLGYGDSTSIVFWQQVGAEVRFIDYYENHGEKLEHYVRVLQSKPYVYGSHYFPHDAGSGSLQTGTTTQKLAFDLGVKAVVLERETSINPGIELARSLITMSYFDEKNCKQLIKCLENYCKRYNDKMQIYSDTPIHNWASHGADAFRYAAIARQTYGKGATGLTPERINEMRQKHLGY